MKKQHKGRIINISSAHSRIPYAYKSAYSAAKFGQVGFTQVTALETTQLGITCNAIMPGPVRTELIEKQQPKLAEQDGTTIHLCKRLNRKVELLLVYICTIDQRQKGVKK